MHLLDLHVTQFRNLKTQALRFHPRLNVIFGENGSGKTAFLEALYFLGRARSFRERQSKRLIAHGQDFFRLRADLQDGEGVRRLGVERQFKDLLIRCDGRDLKNIGQLAEVLPVQVINSQFFALVDGAPEGRRRFADYGLFFYTPDFLPTWRRYQFALKGRNVALREEWDLEFVRAWHGQLAEAAVLIDAWRADYFKSLEKLLNAFHQAMGGVGALVIRYQRGFAQELSLEEVLERNLMRDVQLRYTQDGVHRAQWRIFDETGRDVAQVFSRGQQKTMLCALLLAQAHLIAEKSGKRALVLVDDVGAELDQKRQSLLLDFLLSSGAQVFLSFIELPNFLDRAQAACWQVKSGMLLAR